MMLGFFSEQDWSSLKPLFALGIGAMFVLVASLALKGRRGEQLLLAAGMASVLAAVGYFHEIQANADFFGHQLVNDHFALWFGFSLLFLLLVCLPVFSWAKGHAKEGLGGTYALILFSALGGLLMILSNQLILFFVGLEILSLPLYVLTAFGRKSDHASEAAFKYFILGALASALFVYGAALLWGALGTLTITEMPLALRALDGQGQGLVLMGALLVFVSLSFKIGLVPFQMWLPDVYQGAPASLVAWMSGAVKIAVFPMALRLFGQAFIETSPTWTLALSWVAALSMVIGSFAALVQTNLKRMLAYSSIAHAGYALMAIICAVTGDFVEAGNALVFYLLLYGLASLGSFVVVELEESEGRGGVEDLAGLAKRRPVLAFALALTLLSLAGIPPLGGFVAKFSVFALAVHQGHLALVFIAVGTSVISLAYYLRILVAAYMKDSEDVQGLSRSWAIRFTLGVSVLAVVLLGLFPGVFFPWLASQ